jgi:4-hydroxy-tetrahydrodipicolinate synthase
MDASTVKERVKDVCVVVATPFDDRLELDLTGFADNVSYLARSGIRTILVGGNTGEFYCLTPAERATIIRLTAEEAGGEAQILVGIGTDAAGAVADARAAREAGAQLVMVHQPVHPYVSADGWVDYHRTIAEAVPELAVVPYIRNPLLPGEALARLGADCPNVVGVKYAVPDAVRFATVAREAGLDRFVWVAGLAELYAPSYFASGATGFTSGLVNVAPERSLAMLRALRAGDYPAAMAVWEDIRRFEELRAEQQSAHNVTVVKEGLAALGLCPRDVRPPSSLLPPERRPEVAAIVYGWTA